MIIKKILILLLLIAGLILLPMEVFAEDPIGEVCSVDPSSSVCQNASSGSGDGALVGPSGIITRVTGLLSVVAGVAAVIAIIIYGLQFILSTGDPQKVAKAKNGIIFAVIGLVVVVLARTIALFALTNL